MHLKRRLFNSLIKVFEKELEGNGFELFVFGSQANRAKLIAADIDLGFRTNRSLELSTLNRIKHQLNNELPSLYTFDVVDFNKVETSFAAVALKNIEILHNDTSKSES